MINGWSLFLLIIPFLIGAVNLLLILFAKERLSKIFTILVTLASLITAIIFIFNKVSDISLPLLINGYCLVWGKNILASSFIFFVNLFGFLVSLYSFGCLKNARLFFVYLPWLIAFSNSAFLAKDFVSFVFSWGGILVLLYLLLGPENKEGAKKALVILGFTDFALILGIGIYISLSQNISMGIANKVPLNNFINWLAFLLMVSAALAKAGSGPFHTWIPLASETAPIPVMAILPASLDKLLGIYLLARICVDFFVLNSFALILLLIIGSITIMFAVLMALIQHDLRRLLSFHAISQVGYMVLGFGTGNPLGVVGGIFHMINHAIYKTGLFLSGGYAADKKNTFELDKLGGLASLMPITFVSALIFSFSISGVPPFNGFASKWLIYQATIAGISDNLNLSLKIFLFLALISAMFGSALTLASFIKFISAVFLGKNEPDYKINTSANEIYIKIPLIILALFCILLGIFPLFFLKKFILPGLFIKTLEITGSWNSGLAASLLLIGLFLGLFFVFSAKNNVRKDNIYIGSETTRLDTSFPATEYYRSIEEFPIISNVYNILKKECYDIYTLIQRFFNIAGYILFICIDRLIYKLTNLCGYIILGLSWLLRKIHTGVLDMYLSWVLAGFVVILGILFKLL